MACLRCALREGLLTRLQKAAQHQLSLHESYMPAMLYKLCRPELLFLPSVCPGDSGLGLSSWQAGLSLVCLAVGPSTRCLENKPCEQQIDYGPLVFQVVVIRGARNTFARKEFGDLFAGRRRSKKDAVWGSRVGASSTSQSVPSSPPNADH